MVPLLHDKRIGSRRSERPDSLVDGPLERRFTAIARRLDTPVRPFYVTVCRQADHPATHDGVDFRKDRNPRLVDRIDRGPKSQRGPQASI